MNVKLVVKAPNQKYCDQSFDINLTWTVKQLKEFLSKEYPSKPAVGDQRLIYSGHLLKDDQALSGVFQPISSSDSVVTIHLVCAQRATSNDTNHTIQKSSENTSSNNNNTSSNTVNSSIGNSGQPGTNLVNNSAAANVTGHNESQAATAAALTASMLAQMNMNPSNLVNPLMPSGLFRFGVPPYTNGQTVNLSPEEANAMQQLYSRLLSNYSAVSGFVPGVLPPFGFNPLLANGQFATYAPIVQQQQLQQEQQQQQNLQQQQNRPQPQVLAPGPINEEDDDDENRDWLGWFYWSSRALILFSIVYFYSSFTRFILVVGFALFMYLYQIGLFFPRNAIEEQRPQQAGPLVREQAQQPAPQADQGNNILPQVPQNNQVGRENEQANGDLPPVVMDAGVTNDGLRARRRHSLAADTNTNNNNNRNVSSDLTHERLSGLRMAWVVVSSLFTSLIPEQPQFNLH